MQEYLVFVVIAVVLLVVAIAGWYESQRQKKRQQAMRQAAEKLGLVFESVAPGEFDGRLAKYQLLSSGRGRQSNNFILASTDELSLVLFDHHYTTGSGKNKQTHRQTIAWISSPQLLTPQFSIVPENWFRRLTDLFLKADIDIPGDPEFSKRFVLTGPDADQIREFFTLNRRETLLKYQLPTIECFLGELMFYRPGKLVPPDQLKALMNEAFQIYQAFASEHNTSDSATA